MDSIGRRSDLSRRFAEWRANMGSAMTLERVCEAVKKHLPADPKKKEKEIGTSTINNYEARNDPSARFLVALKKAFPNDVDLEWLMFGEEGAPEGFALGEPPKLRARKPSARRKKRFRSLGDGVRVVNELLLELALYHPEYQLGGDHFEVAVSRPGTPLGELDRWLDKWALSPFKQLPEHFIGIEELTQAEAATYCHALVAAIRPLLRVLREDTRLASRPGLPPGLAALFSGLPEDVQDKISWRLLDRGLGSDREEEGDK